MGGSDSKYKCGTKTKKRCSPHKAGVAQKKKRTGAAVEKEKKKHAGKKGPQQSLHKGDGSKWKSEKQD